MAKRKRLTPANPAFLEAGPTEASPLPGLTTTAAETPPSRAPIADVATEAATTSALEEMTARMVQDRENGRLVETLNLAEIELDYLVRDRVSVDPEEMQTLMASIREHGQRTPIDVVILGPKRYGLISGWRRCEAVRCLIDAGEPIPGIKALLRRPDGAASAYQSMVEENEIRVGLSYYERAHIAARAVEQGVYETPKAALLSLFSAASRAKRSKIRSFLKLVEQLDGAVLFPHVVGERLGLALAKQIEADAAFGPALKAQLIKVSPSSPEDELALLSAFLERQTKPQKTPVTEPVKDSKPPAFDVEELRPGLSVKLHHSSGRVEISGEAFTEDLRSRLLSWLQSQA